MERVGATYTKGLDTLLTEFAIRTGKFTAECQDFHATLHEVRANLNESIRDFAISRSSAPQDLSAAITLGQRVIALHNKYRTLITTHLSTRAQLFAWFEEVQLLLPSPFAQYIAEYKYSLRKGMKVRTFDEDSHSNSWTTEHAYAYVGYFDADSGEKPAIPTFQYSPLFCRRTGREYDRNMKAFYEVYSSVVQMAKGEAEQAVEKEKLAMEKRRQREISERAREKIAALLAGKRQEGEQKQLNLAFRTRMKSSHS